MFKRFLLFSVLIFSINLIVIGQANDPVLFTVEDTPVHVSEFRYIYTKTNGEKADFSKASLDEYLDLYKKFKLKVQRAKEMKLDTIPALQQELAGYRRQLADSYLIDKEVTDRLTTEAYNRSLKDVSFRHVMVKLASNAPPADSLKAFQKITQAQKELAKGSPFEAIVSKYSEDEYSKNDGGYMGYITVLLQKGIYPLESAVYNTPKGKMSNIFRSPMGYHIVKVDNIREARGQMEVAHILIREGKGASGLLGSKTKIDSINQALKAGANWDELAKLSDDKRSSEKGGYLGFFGIRQYEKVFEDAAFNLKEDGAISEPFRSSIGWHIVKRISKKEREPEDLAKRRFQPRVKKDSRYEMAKVSFIEKIKTQNNFTENEAALDQFIKAQNAEFLTYKWKAPKEKPTDWLFTLGKDEKIMLSEFQEYCQSASRKRMRGGNKADISMVINGLYQDFINENCLKYEEKQLEKKYPEFKSLMREYEEGILLFEATKMLVWDKASQDTVGLEKFHSKRQGIYKWKERAEVSMYSVKPDGVKNLNKIKKCAKKDAPEKVLEKFNKDKKLVNFQSKTIEKGKNKVLDAMTWKVGEISPVEINTRNKSSNFMKIEKLIPAGEKSLKEARGYVVADYQDYLERQWLEELAKNYKVEVNQEAYEALIRK